MLRLTRSIAAETGAQEPVPCRRRRAELRGERQGAARRHVRRTSGSSPRRATPAARSARRWSRTTCTRASLAGALNGSGDRMKGAYLGPELRPAGMRGTPARRGRAVHGARRRRADRHACAQALAEGKALGWFQGRMEFGPRALGGRSILGDARSPTMQSVLNLKVKYRESFRPFAPSVLRERVADWFELDHDSPYMLLVADVVEAPPASDDAGGSRHSSASRSSTSRARTSPP